MSLVQKPSDSIMLRFLNKILGKFETLGILIQEAEWQKNELMITATDSFTKNKVIIPVSIRSVKKLSRKCTNADVINLLEEAFNEDDYEEELAEILEYQYNLDFTHPYNIAPSDLDRYIAIYN